MLLDGKVATIFGAAGAIGSAVARVYAREGATVFLSGRNHGSVEAVADEIRKSSGKAEVAQVDALDEQAVSDYLADVIARAGTIDVVLNATGLQPVEYDMGRPSVELEYEKFLWTINAHVGSQFLTARAAARLMMPRRSGVIFVLGSPTGKVPFPGTVGIATSNTALEGLARTLAVELGPVGIRVVYLKVGPFLETRGVQQAIEAFAETAGMPSEAISRSVAEASLMKRTPTLQEAAEVISFLASDRASAVTGIIANITAGQYAD